MSDSGNGGAGSCRGICLIPSCNRLLAKAKNARGLCGPCYANAKRAVAIRETTWAELEQLGLSLSPSRRYTLREETAFQKALRQARQRKVLDQISRANESAEDKLLGL